MALVALEPIFARVLFTLLSRMILAANYDTAVRIWPVWKVTRKRFDEATWVRWNIVRAVASTVAFGCLITALVF